MLLSVTDKASCPVILRAWASAFSRPFALLLRSRSGLTRILQLSEQKPRRVHSLRAECGTQTRGVWSWIIGIYVPCCADVQPLICRTNKSPSDGGGLSELISSRLTMTTTSLPAPCKRELRICWAGVPPCAEFVIFRSSIKGYDVRSILCKRKGIQHSRYSMLHVYRKSNDCISLNTVCQAIICLSSIKQFTCLSVVGDRQQFWCVSSKFFLQRNHCKYDRNHTGRL